MKFALECIVNHDHVIRSLQIHAIHLGVEQDVGVLLFNPLSRLQLVDVRDPLHALGILRLLLRYGGYVALGNIANGEICVQCRANAEWLRHHCSSSSAAIGLRILIGDLPRACEPTV